MSETEQLEKLLVEACQKLEQERRNTCMARPTVLSECSAPLRDWYGRWRAQKRQAAGLAAGIKKR